MLPQGIIFPHMGIQVFPQLDPHSVGWTEECTVCVEEGRMFFFFTYRDIVGQQPSHPVTGPEWSNVNVACLKVMTDPGLHALVRFTEIVQD